MANARVARAASVWRMAALCSRMGVYFLESPRHDVYHSPYEYRAVESTGTAVHVPFFSCFCFCLPSFLFFKNVLSPRAKFREMSYSYYLECENMMITIIIVFIGVLLSLCSLLPSRMHDPVFFPGGLS